jgi:hypothetical protein
MPILRKGMAAHEPLIMKDYLLWNRMNFSLHSRRSSESEMPHLPDEESSYTEST